MFGKPERKSSSKGAPSDPDRMPTAAELLDELKLHGAKAPPRKELPAVSRRTRDFLLLAGVGSVVIVAVLFRVMSGSDAAVVARLALTAVALLCGLLWFIFYGVMSRY
jgi:hypothetical protein